VTSGEDKANDQPPTVAAGNDETTIVPPPTEAAPDLAWSSEVPPSELRRLRPGDDGAIGSADLPGQPFLDIGPQSRVGDQLRGLRPTCGHVGFSLRDRRPVLQLPAPGGSVAPQFP
jgi:hypothetical protein